MVVSDFKIVILQGPVILNTDIALPEGVVE